MSRKASLSARHRHDCLASERSTAPGLEAAEESGDVGETLSFEDERRTGARFFVWSRTVRDDRLSLREVPRLSFDARKRDVNRARNVSVGVGDGVAHVEDGHRASV